MLIFTDASYQRKMAGLGWVILDQVTDWKAGTYLSGLKDNNDAELAAIYYAIKYCQQNAIFKKTRDTTISIVSDSTTAIDIFRGEKEPLNRTQKFMLDESWDMLRKTSMRITPFQIKGHNKGHCKLSYFNSVADAIAGDFCMLGIRDMSPQLICRGRRARKVARQAATAEQFRENS